MVPTPLRRMPTEWLNPPGHEALNISLLPGGHYYTAGDYKLPILSHPLYHQVFYHPVMHEWTNKAIPQKWAAMEDTLKRRGPEPLVWFFERAYRNDVMYVFYQWTLGEDVESVYLPGLPESLDDFQRRVWEAWMLKSDIDPSAMYQFAASVWTDNENIYQNVAEWSEVYLDAPDGKLWMEKDELDTFLALPKQIDIYRGECNDGGWSWSTERNIGEFFARRGINESTGVVVHARIPKELVFSYFGHRGESEVIVLHDDMSEFELERYSVKTGA